MKVAVVAGPFADAETLIAARDLVGENKQKENLFIAPSLYDSDAIDELNVLNYLLTTCHNIDQVWPLNKWNQVIPYY